MRGVLILVFFVTLLLIFWVYRKDRDIKKMFKSLLMFVVVDLFTVLSLMTKPILIIFFPHIALVVVSWLALFWYILRDKYYPYLHLAPLATLILYVISEFLFGSGSLDLS
ncbi:MAG: hypothetical protein U9N49_04950 [Campylobacterota bacterium]|nr:hypothetical protein [Campylobacterota bacterium]